MVGLTLALARHGPPLEAMPFECARHNFMAAARHGLDASLLWPAPEAPSPRAVPVRHLLGRLIPEARDGLVDAGVDADEAAEHLQLIADRLSADTTGASWQRSALRRAEPHLMRGQALAEVLDAYIAQQRTGAPVQPVAGAGVRTRDLRHRYPSSRSGEPLAVRAGLAVKSDR